MALPVALTRNFGRQTLILKKNSPHILFVAGVVGVVTSTVLACRATLKLSATLDEIHNDVKSVKTLKETSDKTGLTAYSENEYAKDASYVYTKGTVKIVKLYAPAVLIGVGSIAMLTKSHLELTKRNTALMAAYAAVQEAFNNYRDRVREELGEEKELDLYHGAKTEIHNKEEFKIVDPNKMSPYARFFDEWSKEWRREPEVNQLFIQCQQNYANNLLIARGHLFLNEVYDMLGIERSGAGAVVGWFRNNDGSGDNYVDFNIYNAYNSRFVNGGERSILLDFNVDGVIYDKLDKKGG